MKERSNTSGIERFTSGATRSRSSLWLRAQAHGNRAMNRAAPREGRRKGGGRPPWPALFLILGRPCCTVEPRTNSATSLDGASREEESKAAFTATAVATGPGGDEARDVLHPLPSLNHRHSAYPTRGSLAQPGQPSPTGAACPNQGSLAPSNSRRQSKPSVGRRPPFPSRTLGSLTAWQMLAADVQQEMEEAGVVGHGSRESGASAGLAATGASRCRGSIEPSLVMSEGDEVLLQGDTGASDTFGLSASAGCGDSFTAGEAGT